MRVNGGVLRLVGSCEEGGPSKLMQIWKIKGETERKAVEGVVQKGETRREEEEGDEGIQLFGERNVNYMCTHQIIKRSNVANQLPKWTV